MEPGGTPHRVVNAVAPVRVCDNGGWTDTWFAGRGCVCSIAVLPGAEVRVVADRASDGGGTAVVEVAGTGERFAVGPGRAGPSHHRLLTAAIEEAGVPDGVHAVIRIGSEVPAGCGTGTSAAVVVALIAAIDALTPGRLDPDELARRAHRVETDRLGLQSGIQDQLVAAHGGVCFIDMPRYPQATVSQVAVPADARLELGRRLVVVFLGRPHRSSEVHEQVIAGLTGDDATDRRLDALRAAAHDARAALEAGDLDRFGRALRANTAAQAALHPALVGPDAQAVFDLAHRHGAVGWKVNGAGGDGGSVSILCGPLAVDRARLVAALPAVDARFRVLPVRLSAAGVRVWGDAAGAGDTHSGAVAPRP